MPAPLDQITSWVHEAESVPNPIERAPNLIDDVTHWIYKGAMNVETNGLDAAAQFDAEYAGVAWSEIMATTANVALLGNVLGALTLVYSFKNALQRLPGPFGSVAKLFFAVFPGLAAAGDTLSQKITDSSHKLVQHHLTTTKWAVTHSGVLETPKFAANQPVVTTVTAADINRINNEIAAMNGKIEQLSGAVGIQEHSSGVPQQVWNEIHAVQKQQQLIIDSITDLDSRVRTAQATADSAQHQLSNLQNDVTGIRTTTAGWQDVKTEVNKLSTTLTQRVNDVQGQIHSNTTSLALLAPLALLLAPGIQGLRTLRQLEDTPCMCPKLPDIDPPSIEALAIMMYVENG